MPTPVADGLTCQIIYGILGVPLEDLQRLTEFAAIRSNGSATATEASSANQYVALNSKSGTHQYNIS